MTVVRASGNISQATLIIAFMAAAIGLLLKPKSSGASENAVGKRTTRHFQINGNIVPIIEKWAQQNRFRVVKTVGSERTYRIRNRFDGARYVEGETRKQGRLFGNMDSKTAFLSGSEVCLFFPPRWASNPAESSAS